MTRTRRHLAAALLTAAAGAVGWAQTAGPSAPPAARLLPARPVESALVTRGYAPEPGTFGSTKPPIKTLSEQRSWTGSPLNPQATDARRQPPTPPPSAPLPEPRRQPLSPLAQPQQPPAPAYATGAGGVYAGPPAYRWYGYGTTTPGANPLAPTGQYPKGSANWYAQTGATPGAFPVPVTAGGEPLSRFEPPAYASAPPPAPAARPMQTVTVYPPRDSRPAPTFDPPVRSAPSRPVSTALPPPTVSPPPPPAVPALPPPAADPTRRAGEPAPIAVSKPTPVAESKPTVLPLPRVEAPPAPPPPAAALTPGLTWQSSAGPKDSLTFTAAKPAEPIATSAPTPAPPAVVPLKDEPAAIQFKPGQPAPTVEPPPVPAVPALPVVPPPATDWKSAPQARGQAPTAEPVGLAAQLRDSCYGLATVSEVTHAGPSTLVVRLSAATEADARAAAASAAKLPALRPYTVRFDITLAGR